MNRNQFLAKNLNVLTILYLSFFVFIVPANGEITQVDSNFDGKMDQWRHMSPNGKIIKVEYDTDFNGTIDQIEYYEGKKIMTKAEFDSNKDGQMDQVQHYGKSG